MPARWLLRCMWILGSEAFDLEGFTWIIVANFVMMITWKRASISTARSANAILAHSDRGAVSSSALEFSKVWAEIVKRSADSQLHCGVAFQQSSPPYCWIKRQSEAISLPKHPCRSY